MALQNLLFLAVLALLPIQLNKFFFIESSYVFGIPIDYRALSLYLSDIATLLFIFVYYFKKLNHLKSFYSQNKAILISLAIFNSYLIANNLLRDGFLITFYFSARVLILSLFFIAASQIISSKIIKNPISSVLCISLIWQSALIILQFFYQKSQGLWFLGERSFDSGTVSIAHVDIFGLQLLRSYGTFPHPNIAGAFLVLTLIFIYINLDSKKDHKLETIVKSASILSLLGVLLTFSRSAFAVLSLTWIFFSENVKSLIIKLTALLSLTIFLIPLLINTQLASVAERLTLTQASLNITSQNLFFGVGNTNFLTHLASLNLTSLAQTRLIQPVHNVFLLILSENGLIGFSLFILFQFFISQKAKNKGKRLLFMAILVFASADHFFWTLHQGQVLFWLSLAFITAERKNGEIR